ncbi:MAG TPA: pyridoxamine 5'-phosphate oxidase family protein [Solirubrobacteraceae bacterium]
MHEPRETTNLDRYGNAPLEWSRARDLLAASPEAHVPMFLGTVRPDGRPHSAGVGATWFEGDMYIVSGLGTRKSRNLAANPACTLSLALTGMDIVLEGEAQLVTDDGVLEALAARYNEGGWPARVADGAFTAPYSAPSAGPPPWHVYRMKVHTAFGVAGAEPHGATRWRF